MAEARQAAPGAEQVPGGIPRGILLVVALGVFLAQLDGTVINVALPTLSRAFHTPDLSSVQPVITAYLVTSVALLPVLGKLADSYGRKRLFLAGFSIFAAASLIASFSTSLGMLIALRIVQAAGGALLSGTSLAIVAAASGSRRGESLGRLSLVYALSGLLGPPVGGGLIQVFGWQSVFWLNVPLGIIGIVAGARLLPPDRRGASANGRIDVRGAALFASATALVAAGAAAARTGSLAIGPVAAAWPILVVAGLLAYLLLLSWERGAARDGVDPLLDVALLRTPAYGLGLVLAFISNGVTIALFVLVPFWLTKGWGVGAAAQGLIFLPVALGLGGLAPFAGKRSDTIGARLLTTAGMSAGAVGALLLACQASDLIWPVTLFAMLLIGASSGLFAAPNNSAVLAAAPEGEGAVASSMLSAARTLGVIVGVSAAGSAFDTLRAGGSANSAARVLFLIAAALYAINALLCWAIRPAAAPLSADGAPAHPVVSGTRRGARPRPIRKVR